MGHEGQKELEKKQRKPRGPKWSLWETLLAVQAVIAVRDKYAQGIGNAEMMREFNRVYMDLVDECEKQQQCVDQHGFQDRRVSAQMSKQHRVVEVLSNTRTTPISRHFEKILCAIRNHLLPLLTKILDNGRIPSGRQNDDVLQELRAMYYKEMKMDGAKPDSGDSGAEDDGAGSAFQMDDFHPHEYYVFCKWGPTVIGGCGHVNFLKNSEDMQESLGNKHGRAKWRENKTHSENADAKRAKTLAISDALYKLSTPPSPAASSHSSSSSDNPRTLTALALKKLDHDIRKAELDAIVHLRTTLAQQAVRPPHFAPFPALSSWICLT
jgi:hypothetical protein